MNSINHLYLLIGTNPLSNYVVADYFLKNETDLKAVHLIHSVEDSGNNIQSTESIAAHLKSVLKEKTGTPVVLHGICIRDAFFIHQDVSALLKGVESEAVHLDYSGGTKEMALHSYETFKELCTGQVTFSYFDSRSNRLKKDSGTVEPVESVFLGDLVEITFDELFKLHGYRRVPEEDNKGSVFSVDFFRDFLELISRPDFFCDYVKWREFFFHAYPDPRHVVPAEGFETLEDLLPKENEISEFLKDTLFLKIHNEMPENSLLEEQDGRYFLRRDVSNKQMDKLIETRKYITGHWFEQYVYLVLQENRPETASISSIDLNILVQTAAKNFEIDVAMINGYELCGISCTTDKTQSLCKSKGFEILHRTKQIAGDNSKSILMTFMNEENTQIVDADLSEILEDRILVLGLHDLFPKKKFFQKIADFLNL